MWKQCKQQLKNKIENFYIYHSLTCIYFTFKNLFLELSYSKLCSMKKGTTDLSVEPTQQHLDLRKSTRQTVYIHRYT